MEQRQTTVVSVTVTWLQPELTRDLALPAYETAGSAGMDVCAAVETPVDILPGERVLIPTGLAVALPEGYEIQVRSRSGLAVRHGVSIINSPGTIDADYRGEVRIGLVNFGDKTYTIRRGDRIAQLVVAPVIRAALHLVEALDETERGSGGFGHTGI